MATKKRAKVLDWKYCECGCHGHYLYIGILYYWMFNDLKGNFYLKNGHKWHGEELGCYKSFGDADRAARDHARPQVAKLQKAINRVARALRI